MGKPKSRKKKLRITKPKVEELLKVTPAEQIPEPVKSLIVDPICSGHVEEISLVLADVENAPREKKHWWDWFIS